MIAQLFKLWRSVHDGTSFNMHASSTPSLKKEKKLGLNSKSYNWKNQDKWLSFMNNNWKSKGRLEVREAERKNLQIKRYLRDETNHNIWTIFESQSKQVKHKKTYRTNKEMWTLTGYSMIIRSDRERQVYDIAYVWNLKRWLQMNLFTKQKQTHRLWKLIYGYWRGKVR